MPELSFDLWDIFKAPRLAWSFRKMIVAIRGIVIAWFIYAIFSYASIFLTQTGRTYGLVNLIRHFEFFPVLLPQFNGSWEYLVYGAGIILALLSLLFTTTALARIAFEDVRGNDVFQANEAIQFAKTHRLTVLLSVVVLSGLLLIFPVSLLLWGFICRIPVVGPLLFAVTSLPLFFWGLLGVAVFVVFLFGFFLIPAITASIGEDVLETVIQTFSTVFYRPGRLLIYEITTKIVVIVSTLILAFFSFSALLMICAMCGQLLGNTFNEIFTVALYRIPCADDLAFIAQLNFCRCNLLNCFHLVDTTSVSIIVRTAGWIMGVSYLLVLAWIMSYALSCCSASHVLIYLAIRKSKDGDDLRLKQPASDFTPGVST